MAGVITVAHLVIDPLAGYAFAKFEFPFKRTIFLVVLSTLMVPFFVRMIPIYVIFSQLGWTNSYQGLIVPFLSDAFGIFLMRQFIQPLPDALIDAARVDGAVRAPDLRQDHPAAGQAGAGGARPVHLRLPVEQLPLATDHHVEHGHAHAAGRADPVQPGVLHPMEPDLGRIGGRCSSPTAVLFFVTQRYLVRGIALTGLK